MSQVLKDDGYVDSLAAGQDVLIGGAVNDACSEMIRSDDVIKGRIEGNSVNHDISPFCRKTVSLPFSGGFLYVIMIAPKRIIFNRNISFVIK
jgi:hypothetical protein